MQASHEGASASTPTGSPAIPVGLQATPPAAQDTSACTQATPGRHQAEGRMEGSTNEAEAFGIQGNEDRQSSAADASQDTAHDNAIYQVGFAMVPGASDCSMTLGVTVGVGVCVYMFKLHSVVKDAAAIVITVLVMARQAECEVR